MRAQYVHSEGGRECVREDKERKFWVKGEKAGVVFVGERVLSSKGKP